MNRDVRVVELDRLHREDRGWGMNPLRTAGAGEEAAAGMHLVSIRPGAVRGNHSHGNATEWIVVFGGAGKLSWRSLPDGTLRESAFGGDGPALFEIPPGVEHAIANTSGRDLYALAFYDHPAPETRPCGPLAAPPDKGETP